jgi:DNA topoisomerase I
MKDVILLCEYYVNCQFGGKSKLTKKWSTFEHNGLVFAPLYKAHNLPIMYDGMEIQLPLLAEEYITLYTRYLDTEYALNKKFHTNFFKSWKSSIKGLGIESLDKCNFDRIKTYIEEEKRRKKEMTKQEKQSAKDDLAISEEKFKTAIVNGIEQPVGNYRLEPPGIFIGRGCHPKMGQIKPRIMPGDVIINNSKGSKTPELPEFYKDKKWKKVVHDNTSEWLASWKDSITGKMKYVWLGSKSELKSQGDIDKFDKARKLKKYVKKIRKENDINLISNDLKTKQLATALYFIDNFSLRVGNEKDDKVEADTVGVTSLRKEHIFPLENLQIKLDFLGKDSVRYLNKVKVSESVYRNIVEFCDGKNKKDDLFGLVNSTDLNNYIRDFGHDFTAKVFRTFNASRMFQEELDKVEEKFCNYNKSDRLDMLLNGYNTANVVVATALNHQKNVSKGYEEGVLKLKKTMLEYQSKIKAILLKDPDSVKSKKQIKKLKEQIKKYKIKKESKIELKNISLGTSKINYIDPRISIAFFKRNDIPVEKGFKQALRDKFAWSLNVDDDWRF